MAWWWTVAAVAPGCLCTAGPGTMVTHTNCWTFSKWEINTASQWSWRSNRVRRIICAVWVKILQWLKYNLVLMLFLVGISELAKTPEKASDYIYPLLSFAAQHIPKNKHQETPLYILCTAGMRILPERYSRSNERHLFMCTRAPGLDLAARNILLNMHRKGKSIDVSSGIHFYSEVSVV